MKHFLSLTIITAISLFSILSKAQVAQLANNSNIEFGVPLGSIGVLADSSGVLWKTDGTSGGTMIYTTKVKVDTGSLINYAVLDGKLYFAGVTAANGSELWVTDGTDGGTHIVKDIEMGTSGSMPRNFTVFNNTIYFFAATADDGVELWKSNGTEAGTVMVADINSGTGTSYDDIYTTFFDNNNILYFKANDGKHGVELWKTDGTTSGTVMIKDINPDGGSSNCTGFTPLGNIVLFGAGNGSNGKELWKTDGTEAGTQMVKDIVTGGDSSNPQQFLPFNGKIYFLTGTGLPVKYKLCVSDGTEGGTVLVKDFGSSLAAFLSLAVIIGNKFYFSVYTPTTGLELWSSDGTTTGTQLFKDINAGNKNGNAFVLPDYLGAAFSGGSFHTRLFNDKVFFIANDGAHGEELWITDGTDAGTAMVIDLNPGSASSVAISSLSWLYTTSGLYFTADDGTKGTELWKTDGTAAGTTLVKDINTGSGSSDPFVFMFLNNQIYFNADDGDNSNGNTDLNKVNEPVTLPLTLLNFTAILNGKAAQLQWTTSTETNTKNFVVQRSTDGTHFTNLGTVNAAGSSTQKTSYQFKDETAFNTGANKLYYRLQMVDKDGRFTYSKIASVTITPDGKLFVVYPNPVKDKLIVVSSVSLGKTEARITDQTGKLVHTQQFENIQAGTENKINVASLNKGVYYLQFITGSDIQTMKFFKY